MAAHDRGKSFAAAGEGHIVELGDVRPHGLGNEARENVIGAASGTAAEGN